MVCVSVFDVALPQLAACTVPSEVGWVALPFGIGVLVALAIDYLLPSDIDTTVTYFEGLAGQRPPHIYPLPGSHSDTASGEADPEVGLSHPAHENYGVRERERGHQPASANAALATVAAAASRPRHPDPKGRQRLHQHWRLAILMFTALTLHNLPEGVGVALSSMGQGTVGASLAVAVAVHNAPEGLAIAVPVFAATKSRWAALAASVISGLSEPVGALLTLLFMRWRGAGTAPSTGGSAIETPASVASADVDFVLSGVAGIMLTVSFVGLLPAAFGYKSVPRRVQASGFLAGLVLIAATIAAA